MGQGHGTMPSDESAACSAEVAHASCFKCISLGSLTYQPGLAKPSHNTCQLNVCVWGNKNNWVDKRAALFRLTIKPKIKWHLSHRKLSTHGIKIPTYVVIKQMTLSMRRFIAWKSRFRFLKFTNHIGNNCLLQYLRSRADLRFFKKLAADLYEDPVSSGKSKCKNILLVADELTCHFNLWVQIKSIPSEIGCCCYFSDVCHLIQYKTINDNIGIRAYKLH